MDFALKDFQAKNVTDRDKLYTCLSLFERF